MSLILKIEFFLKRYLKPPAFRLFCFIGRLIGPLMNRQLIRDRVSNILVFQGGGIGDLVRVFPFLRSLHESFPSASLTVLSPFNRDFFELYPRPDIISEIIVIDVAKKHKSIFSKLKLAARLRERSFDLIICPQTGLGMIEFSVMSFLIGAPYRLGFDSRGAGCLYTTKLQMRDDRSIYAQNIDLLKAAGINAYFDPDYLGVPEDDVAFARSFLLDNGADPDGLLFSISPYVLADTDNRSPQHNRSLAEPRTWQEQKYADLISHILRKYPAKVVLLGSKMPDGELSGLLASSRNPDIISAVGRTTLKQAAALIKFSSMLISNDSGLLHIALALKRPCVGIFGSTSPVQQIMDNSEHCTAIWKRLECSPCYVQEPIPRIECPREIQCLKSITVDEVMKAVEAHINL